MSWPLTKSIIATILYISKEGKMDFGIGDIVKHLEAETIGIVQLIDGVAVWVRWGCGEVNHTNCMQLEILDKAVCA